MAAILATIISTIVQGGSAATAFGALTAGQWGTLIAGVGAEIAPELAKLFGLEPPYSSLGKLIDAIVKSASDDVAKQKMQEWLSANAEWVMKLQPGMGEH